MPKANAVFNFLPSHQEKYGLKPWAHDPESGKVTKAVCRFCAVFGREEKVGAKRSRTNNVKYFSLFRTDGYKRHMLTNHPNKWAEYKRLKTQHEKEYFFQSDQLSCPNNVDVQQGQATSFIRSLINAPIVETVVADILFHKDDADGTSRSQVLEQFHQVEPADDSNASAQNCRLYEAVIESPLRFRLFIGFVSNGASFRMASRLMSCTQVQSGMGVYGGCTDAVAATYTRFACAFALQAISDALRSVWAFAIALHVCTHQNMSYIDVRVRFEQDAHLHSVHLLALALHDATAADSSNADDMADVLLRCLHAVDADWTRRCVAVSHDAGCARVQHVAKRVQQACGGSGSSSGGGGVLLVWTGARQLDAVLRRVLEAMLRRGDWRAHLFRVVAHARQLGGVAAACPKLSAQLTWASVYAVARSLTHALAADGDGAESLQRRAPDAWWLALHALAELLRECSEARSELSGFGKAVAQQRDRLDRLVDKFCRMIGMHGPLAGDQIDDVAAQQPAESCGAFVVTHASVAAFLARFGNDDAQQWLDVLDSDERCELLAMVGKLFVDAADGVFQVINDPLVATERQCELPPVLPQQLCSVDERHFGKIVQRQRDRLLRHVAPHTVEHITHEFAAFAAACRKEPQLRRAVRLIGIGDVDGWHGLRDSWAIVQGRFPLLRQFCCGLAAAFPVDDSVEPDFSVIEWDKNASKLKIADFSLEGILHCNQFKMLQKLSDDLVGQSQFD